MGATPSRMQEALRWMTEGSWEGAGKLRVTQKAGGPGTVKGTHAPFKLFLTPRVVPHLYRPLPNPTPSPPQLPAATALLGAILAPPPPPGAAPQSPLQTLVHQVTGPTQVMLSQHPATSMPTSRTRDPWSRTRPPLLSTLRPVAVRGQILWVAPGAFALDPSAPDLPVSLSSTHGTLPPGSLPVLLASP